MSSLIVKIIRIKEILKHPDPESTELEIAIVNGWQCVIKKNSLKANDLCIYFPLDAVLPFELSEIIGVTKYLSKGRIKATTLRQSPSYGLLWSISSAIPKVTQIIEIANSKPNSTWQENVKIIPKFEEDEDVAAFYNITKWEPPLVLNNRDAETPHPLFFSYTDIQNFRNFIDIIQEGEEVIITEKIHGMNSRCALIENIFMAGSHEIRLKENKDNQHWHVFSDNIKNLLEEISKDLCIVYGELFGSGVQDLLYGYKKGQRALRLFDIRTKDYYMNHDDFEQICKKHDVETVPILYRGPFSLNKVLEFSTSKSMVQNAQDTIMEGVVIKPVKERHHPAIGRVILKYVFDQYYNRKGVKTEFR
jgi:RNA ligase (TIGR02306 family)